MPDEDSGIARPDRTEKALDAASFVASAVPWIGGPVSNVLSGMSVGRKFARVGEVLEGLANDLRDLESEASKAYVRTEEFEDLLEQTLRRVAEERSKEKRRVYRAFLTGAIQSPGTPYDDQFQVLRALEALQPDHLRVLRALMQPPSADPGLMGSALQTLERRLPDLPRDRIEDLITGLNDLRITSLDRPATMMTGHGAEDLRPMIAPFGRRLLGFILED